jgi:FkbM family methyltransferase
MSPIKRVIKNILRDRGYEIIGRSALLSESGFKAQLLEMLDISLILDAGANEGQYGNYIRSLGYAGRIVSFEPMSAAFEKLAERAAADKSWQPMKMALGEQDGTAEINISGNSQSSSILDMLNTHEDAAPDSRYIGSETVTVRRLDSVFNEIPHQGDRIFLKIDTQGFERQVLAGASGVIGQVKMLELEVSFVHLYQDDVLFSDMYALLSKLGFNLLKIEPGFTDPQTGALLQADATFVR